MESTITKLIKMRRLPGWYKCIQTQELVLNVVRYKCLRVYVQSHYGTDGCWCSCQAALPEWVSTALPKVNPLVICFTAAPIAVQTRRVISGKPIIIWHESWSGGSPTWPLPLLLVMCLSPRKKAPCPWFPACLSPPLISRVTHLPAMCRSVWDLKVI